MRPVEGYVPPNINSDNAIGGFMWRNIAEAGAVIILNIVIIAKVFVFIPVYPRIISGILICIFMGLLALFGINGEPLSSYLASFFAHRSTRCIVKLRMPMPHIMTEKERKALELEKKAEDKARRKEQIAESKDKAKSIFSKLTGKKQ